MERNLLIANVLRVYLPITMLVSLTSTVATFINMFLSGIWLTREDVVSISVPSFLTLFISVTGSMVATGSSVIFSRYLVDGRKDKASNCFSIAVYTALVIGVIYFLMCFFYASAIRQGYGSTLSDYISAEYVLSTGLSAIPLLILLISIMFLRMDGDKYLALACFIAYISVDVSSVWFTVQNGNGPFGVGISVGVGSLAALLLTPIHHRIKGHNMVLRRPFELLKGMKLISNVAFRSILNRISMTVRYYFLNAFIVTTGITATSCLTAQNAVLHFVVAVFTGSAIMSAVLGSTFYSQGDRKSLSDAVKELSAISVTIAVITAVAVLILSEGITDLLVDGADMQRSALWCLRWFAVSMPTTTLCMILIYMYQSTKRKMLASALVLLRGVAMIVLAVFAMAPVLGEAAIWACFLLADLCTLTTILALSCIHNRRFPRCVDDLLILKGKKYETPSVFEGSIHNDRDELKELLDNLECLLSDNSIDSGMAKAALDKIESVVGETIDSGYSDSRIHQIDVLIRKDDGLNIVVRSDSKTAIRIPDGVRQSKAVDLNFYYIDFKNPKTFRSLKA